MQPKKLENYKFFQPIAWTVFLSLTGFVTMLVLQLNAAINDLGNSKVSIEERIQNLEKTVYTEGDNQ